ncbi:hypothetical protein ACOSQ4_005354 [Xanthoceras sorbifolium]
MMATNDAYSRCLSDSTLKPRCGLEFDSKKEAYDFYNIRKSYGKNNKTSELTSRIFVCSKHGFQSNDRRDFFTKNNFFVTHFVEGHSHPLTIRKTVFYHGQYSRRIRITLKSSYQLMGKQVGGRQPLGLLIHSYGCLKKFCRRCLERLQKLLSCNCRIFETKGVLYSHIIKVLRDNMNIKEIHAQYLLKKWTKQARPKCVQDIYGRVIQEDPKLQQTSRYRSLCSMFTRISSRISKSENAYNLANEHASNLASIVVECTQNDHLMKAKGLKKKETCRERRRFKSSLEVSLAKKKKLNPPQHSKLLLQLLYIQYQDLLLNNPKKLSSNLCFNKMKIDFHLEFKTAKLLTIPTQYNVLIILISCCLFVMIFFNDNLLLLSLFK